MRMTRDTKDNILMSIVGIVFLLNMLLLSNVLVRTAPAIEELVVLGWTLLVVGALFVILSVLTLRKKGITSFTDSGVYGIVRHPMYVGGMMMFLSHIFFGQDWIIAVSTLVGVYCCYLLIQSEDQQIVEKFGDEYGRYMQTVPRTNFIVGIMRVLRRGKGK
jgi:protein-S-isoprenylcysteine O-methyltransferase Ste14